MFGIRYKPGDIVLVPVPFTDFSHAKQRPALVISAESNNIKTEDLVICGITSNIKDEDYSIIFEQKDMAEGNIHFLSRIKVNVIFTVRKTIIKKKLGRINNTVFGKVKEQLYKLFS